MRVGVIFHLDPQNLIPKLKRKYEKIGGTLHLHLHCPSIDYMHFLLFFFFFNHVLRLLILFILLLMEYMCFGFVGNMELTKITFINISILFVVKIIM